MVAPVCGSGPVVLEVNTSAVAFTRVVESGACNGGWLSVVLLSALWVVLLVRLK